MFLGLVAKFNNSALACITNVVFVFRPCHSIVNFERRTTYFVKVFIALPTTLTFLFVFHFEMIRILGALAQKHNVSIVLKQFGAATENYTHILYLLRG